MIGAFSDKKYKIFGFLLLLFVINLLQSIFTPLLGDEAYYWIYSQNLAFGYFDHPPAIAFVIKLSDLLFSNELSVRFFTVILNTLTAFFIWKLIPERNRVAKNAEWIFLLSLMIIPGFNIYGFVSTPDVPLLFFFVLYLHAFNAVLKIDNLLSSLLLGVLAVLMIYSKYHAAILILLSVITNLHILRKKSIYIAGFIASVLIVPHLYWQYEHDFVTFNYHLFQRTDGSVSINNVLDFFLGSSVMLNPLVLGLLFFYLFKAKLKLQDESKIYLRLFLGILIFFFIYSFRSKIEAHWVVAAVIPLVILIQDLFSNYWERLKKYSFVAYAFLLIIMIMRIALILPLDIKETEFHSEGGAYFEAIKERAGDKKVIFANSYRRAAKYQFYTGGESFTKTYYYYRKSQFDLENYDEIFHNESVLFIGYWEYSKWKTIHFNPENIDYTLIDKFPVFNKIKGEILDFEPDLKLSENIINLKIENQHSYELDFTDTINNLKLQILLVKEGKKHIYPVAFEKGIFESNSELEIKTLLDLKNIEKGEYNMMLVMRSKHSSPVLLSKKYKVEIDN